MKRLFLKASYDTKTGLLEMLYRGDFVNLPLERRLYVLQQVGDSVIHAYLGALAQMLKPARKPRAPKKMSRAIH